MGKQSMYKTEKREGMARKKKLLREGGREQRKGGLNKGRKWGCLEGKIEIKEMRKEEETGIKRRKEKGVYGNMEGIMQKDARE